MNLYLLIHPYPHTSKLLILFPSPGGRGVRGEGGNLCNIMRLAHTPKPFAGWRKDLCGCLCPAGEVGRGSECLRRWNPPRMAYAFKWEWPT